MRCTGCGRNVPFGGEVCPNCLRDKSSDQQGAVASGIAIIIGAILGNVVAGFGGMVIGGIGLGLLVAIVTASSKGHSAKKPPRVRVESSPIAPSRKETPSTNAATTAAANDPATRLRQLDKLKTNGLVTAAEYNDQRRAIIQAV